MAVAGAGAGRMIPGMVADLRALWARLKPRLALLLLILTVMWVLEAVDTLVLGQRLNALGIMPRDTDALPGILWAPLLHAGFAHLLANSVPFALLGGILLARSVREFLIVTVLGMLLGGLGVWLIGAPNSIHFGASGLVFAYFGYLLFRGIFERSLPSIFIATVVAAGYGSMLLGVLPGQRGISWEGHLFGFLAGVLAARLLSPRPPAARFLQPLDRS